MTNHGLYTFGELSSPQVQLSSSMCDDSWTLPQIGWRSELKAELLVLCKLLCRNWTAVKKKKCYRSQPPAVAGEKRKKEGKLWVPSSCLFFVLCFFSLDSLSLISSDWMYSTSQLSFSLRWHDKASDVLTKWFDFLSNTLELWPRDNLQT